MMVLSECYAAAAFLAEYRPWARVGANVFVQGTLPLAVGMGIATLVDGADILTGSATATAAGWVLSLFHEACTLENKRATDASGVTGPWLLAATPFAHDVSAAVVLGEPPATANIRRALRLLLGVQERLAGWKPSEGTAGGNARVRDARPVVANAIKLCKAWLGQQDLTAKVQERGRRENTLQVASTDIADGESCNASRNTVLPCLSGTCASCMTSNFCFALVLAEGAFWTSAITWLGVYVGLSLAAMPLIYLVSPDLITERGVSVFIVLMRGFTFIQSVAFKHSKEVFERAHAAAPAVIAKCCPKIGIMLLIFVGVLFISGLAAGYSLLPAFGR